MSKRNDRLRQKGVADRRQKSIQALWVGVRQLGWSKERFYDLLEEWGYGRSVSALTPRQLGAVIDLLRTAGYAPARRGAGAQPAAGGGTESAAAEADDLRPARYCMRADEDERVAKVMMLWAHLHALGAVRNPSLRSLNAYVKRMTGRSHVRYLARDERGRDEKNRVIEALKRWAARAEREAAARAE